MPTTLLLFAMLILFGIGFALGLLATPRRSYTGTAAELAERDQFIEHLREITWQHRDIAPELATIVLDEIRTHNQRHDPPSLP